MNLSYGTALNLTVKLELWHIANSLTVDPQLWHISNSLIVESELQHGTHWDC